MKVGRPILFLIGLALTIALIAALCAAFVGLFTGYPFFSYLMPNSSFMAALGISCIFILIAVPLVTIMNLIQRITMRKRMNPRFISGSWVLWALAAVGFISSGSYLARDFKVGKEITRNISTENITSDTLRIDFGENPYRDGWITFGPNQVFDDELINTYNYLRIERGDYDHFQIIQKKSSQGRNLREAEDLAAAINSEPFTTSNSVTLPSYFSLLKGTKYRGQHVETIIRVPEGKYIYFGDRESGWRNYDVDFNDRYEHPWLEDGQIWRMTDAGLILPSYIEDPNELTFSDFRQIEISGDMQIEIERSDSYEVSMRGRSRYKKHVDIKQEGEKLKIDFDMDRHHKTLRLFIKAPDLSSLSVFDTDDVKIEGFDFENFEIKSTGRQEIKGKFNAQNLSVKLEDQTRLKLDGEGDFFNAVVEDNADLYADDFEVRKAELKTKGEDWKKIRVSVSDTLVHDFAHDLDFKVDGRPWVLDKNQVPEEMTSLSNDE